MSYVAVVAVVVVLLLLSPTNVTARSDWRWWGADEHNSRHATGETRLDRDTIGALRVRWRYDLPVDAGISTTPTLLGERLFFTDWGGNVTCLDKSTGRLIWSQSYGRLVGIPLDGSRSAPLILDDKIIVASYYGLQPAYVAALSIDDGELIWKTMVSDQMFPIVTSSPVAAKGMIFIGISSAETVFGPTLVGKCCSFRGNVLALEEQTGEIVWRTYMIPEPEDPSDGASGASVWGSSFSFDFERNHVYVGTGNPLSWPKSVQECQQQRKPGEPLCMPEDALTNSIVALDMDTGKVQWSTRTVEWDGYNTGCDIYNLLGLCPDPYGDDYDVSQGPITFTIERDGTSIDVVGAGTKSGNFWTVTRDEGKVIWVRKVGPGGKLGGLELGSAYDGKRIYCASANSFRWPWIVDGQSNFVGSHWAALDPNTGEVLWQTIDPNWKLEKETNLWGESVAFGPVTTANGLVFVGTTNNNGTMYVLDGETGDILWSFDSGTAVVSGPSIVDGVVYWAVGYDGKWGFKDTPGVLFAFDVPDFPAGEQQQHTIA